MNTKKLYQKFWENGYVIVPNFLKKKEINQIFFQLNDLLNIAIGGKKNRLINLNNINRRYLYLKNKNPKLKSHFYDLTQYSDKIVNLAGSDKFLKYAKLFLDSKTTFIEAPQVRIDHPKEKLNLPEHQELNLYSKDVITIWVPLVKTSKINGGIYLRPKTHKLGHVKYEGSHIPAGDAGNKRSKILENLFNKKKFRKFKSISPKLKAGDALMFHSFIFHGTHPNLTNKIRWTYISRYNSIKNAPYLKDKNAPLNIPYGADYNFS